MHIPEAGQSCSLSHHHCVLITTSHKNMSWNKLGGGFKYFFIFSPRKLGKISNLNFIFFRWVGSTTNHQILPMKLLKEAVFTKAGCHHQGATKTDFEEFLVGCSVLFKTHSLYSWTKFGGWNNWKTRLILTPVFQHPICFEKNLEKKTKTFGRRWWLALCTCVLVSWMWKHRSPSFSCPLELLDSHLSRTFVWNRGQTEERW